MKTYVSIDYASLHSSKTHAHLAATYLIAEVEQILPHDMPDVLMEGLRLIGQCGRLMLAADGPEGIVTIVEKIGIISCAGAARESYRPITPIGVGQIVALNLDLFRSKHDRISFASAQIRNSIKMISMVFLSLPDTPFMSLHSAALAPYYSTASRQSLAFQISEIVNAIADAPADSTEAKQIISNIEEWADGIYQGEKELLLLAIEKRSHFAFDVIHWISRVSSMLIALSNASACDELTRDKLRKHARWLIAVLDWVPSDKETVVFVEHFRMTETLFDAAIDAYQRDCAELAEDIGKILFSWAFKAGRYQSGWAILERALCGLATLALHSGSDQSQKLLISEISERLGGKESPDEELRDRTARNLRERAVNLANRGHWSSSIESAIAQADHKRLRSLLEQIADTISPNTKGEPTKRGMF